MMPYGLPRKIRIAFTLQALMVSLALLIGGYLVVMVVRHTLVGSVLKEEAAYYWSGYNGGVPAAPPNTRHIRGFLQRQSDAPSSLPEALRGLSPGFHNLQAEGKLVWVEDSRNADARLYLIFERSQAERMALWFGVIPVLLVLLAIYVVSWLTYRVSRRLVSPVSWLARRISVWDPRSPDVEDLAPERLPPDVQGETRQLAIALHTMANRVAGHVARERNFTRDASHELRTPLTVIRGASDIALADPMLGAAQQRALRRIQRAAKDMEGVIDAFLILARESDVEPLVERVDVVALARAEAEALEPLLEGKPVELQVHSVGRCILLAPPRVVQVVVGNLIRNACCYTARGQINVEINDEAMIIRDTGIGMSAETLERVFEPFYRVAGEADGGQGAGLGLSIVRRLCDRFGWQITMESVVGQGTTATIRFV
jgi:signal transduction histidine kinase